MKTSSLLPPSPEQRARYLELAEQLRRPDLSEADKDAIVRDAVRSHRLDALSAVWTGAQSAAYKQSLLFIFICSFAAFLRWWQCCLSPAMHLMPNSARPSELSLQSRSRSFWCS